MNDRAYTIPGLDGWTFKTSMYGFGLWSGVGGPGVAVSLDTPAAEIAGRVKDTLRLGFGASDDVAEAGAQAVLKVDWLAMIQEAGTDVQHQTPGLPGWTLKISDYGSGLWHSGGAGVQITVNTPVLEIAESVRRILQYSLPPVEIDVQVDEIMRIDFRALILNAWSPRPAPLLEDFTADNSVLVESICADVRQLAALQKEDCTATADSICALVKQLV